MIMAQSHPAHGTRASGSSVQQPFLLAAGAAAGSGDSLRVDPAPDPLLRATDDSAQRTPSTWKVVYAIVERGPRKHWLRIGMAFVNRDGSLNVRLDAVPLTGQLHIRENPPRDPAGSFGEPVAAMPFEREPPLSANKSRARAGTAFAPDA